MPLIKSAIVGYVTSIVSRIVCGEIITSTEAIMIGITSGISTYIIAYCF